MILLDERVLSSEYPSVTPRNGTGRDIGAKEVTLGRKDFARRMKRQKWQKGLAYVLGSFGKSGSELADTSTRCSRADVIQISYLYSALSPLSLHSDGLEGGSRGWRRESMAQLTSVWLRMCADNSIDRHCSTDTAYPFHPLRDRLIPSRVVEGRRGPRVACFSKIRPSYGRLCVCMCVCARVRGGKLGRKEELEGVRGSGAPAATALQRFAALTPLTSPTFPDDPAGAADTQATRADLSRHPATPTLPYCRANPVMRLFCVSLLPRILSSLAENAASTPSYHGIARPS